MEILQEAKYPAKRHCRKVADYLSSALDNTVPTTFYLQGQITRLIEDNDEPQPFRQRRHFYYLSGCALPDCHLTYHVPSDTLTLFIPPLDPSSVIWSGLPLLPEEALKKYDIDSCYPSNELGNHLVGKGSDEILAITGPGALPFSTSGFVQQDTESLHPAIDTCRVTKDSYEVALIRKANSISTAAHTAVLKTLKHARNEQELEAVFLERCFAHGAKNQAYYGIFGSGHNAATLHYQGNDQELSGRLNLLVDAAAEWNCYCADVTRTMPLNGKFTKESRAIYETVLRMQDVCLSMLKAGVKWEKVHLRAHEVAIEDLLLLGLLKGSKEDILKAKTSICFFPHGLGHYLGMDTHEDFQNSVSSNKLRDELALTVYLFADTGGNPDYEDKDKMFQYLRVRGSLPEGSVITVEPGLYFCRFIIEPYLKDEKQKAFIDEEILNRYWDVGGVRIEDDILITKDGYENLTTAPKSIDDMTKIMHS